MDRVGDDVFEEDGDGKSMTVFRNGPIEDLCLFEYEDMFPFLHFLDRYAKKVVNGDETKKWRTKDMDKMLINKLTPGDLAYLCNFDLLTRTRERSGRRPV